MIPRAQSNTARSVKRPPALTLAGSVVGLLLAGLILFPLSGMLWRLLFSVEGGVMGAAQRASQQPAIGSVIVNTAIVAGASTTLALIIGTIFAWLNERTTASLGWLGTVLPIIPLLVPPVAGAVGWSVLLSPRAGYLNHALQELSPVFWTINIFSWGGLIGVYTVYLVPFAYLLIAPAFRKVDPALEEAARLSGSSPWRVFLRVSVPVIKPALTASVTLMAIFALAVYSIPIIIGPNAGIEVLSVRIVRLLTATYPPVLDVAMVLSLVVVAAVGGAWLIQRRAITRGHHGTVGGRGTGVHPIQLSGRSRAAARTAMAGYVIVAAVLPMAGILLLASQSYWTPAVEWSALSLDNFRDVIFDNERTRSALRHSLSAATIVAVLTIIAGALIAASGGFAKGGMRRALDVASGVVKLPGALSNMVIAVAFVAALSGPPFNLGGTFTILLLAYVVIYMPQSSISAESAFAQVGGDLVEASQVSGAGTFRTFRKVTLPIMAPGMLTGAAMVFVLVLGDLTATRILAGTRTPMVGFVILDLWENGTFPQLAALAATLSAASSVVLASTVWAVRRSR